MPKITRPTMAMPKVSLPGAPRVPEVLRSPRVPGLGPVASKIVAGLVLAAIVAAAFVFWPQSGSTKVTAAFSRAVGLYPGSDVRILGVRVGTVLEVRPAGDHVDVEIEYDDTIKVPADAKAVVVAPSLVSDRYVQLLPVYNQGPVMTSGAQIPMDRTAVPVELDRIQQSLDDLMVALGPQGANKDGSFSRLLATSADNLEGQGGKFHDTTRDLSQALATLSGGKDDFFATVKNLQSFTSMLAANNDQVRRLNNDLAMVSQQLDAERGDLGAALQNLAVALNEISSFVKDNRTLLKTNIDQLTAVSGTIVKNRDALAETLENAPVAISNLQHAYHPETGTLDTRNNSPQGHDPALLLCGVLITAPGGEQACKNVQQALKSIPGAGALGIPGVGSALPSSLAGPGAAVGTPSSTTVEMRGADPTLGGLLTTGAKR